MPEFFITARSFAAPVVSDESTAYVEADSPEEALTKFAAEYGHPFGLYAAEAWSSADHFQKSHGRDPLAQWLSNHELAKQEATRDLHGYSYLGHGPGDFEVNRERLTVDDPKGGRVSPPVVPREQYERVVAALDQAVEALDVATAALQAEGRLPDRAILSAKLLHATRELRGSVGAAL